MDQKPSVGRLRRFRSLITVQNVILVTFLGAVALNIWNSLHATNLNNLRSTSAFGWVFAGLWFLTSEFSYRMLSKVMEQNQELMKDNIGLMLDQLKTHFQRAGMKGPDEQKEAHKEKLT